MPLGLSSDGPDAPAPPALPASPLRLPALPDAAAPLSDEPVPTFGALVALLRDADGMLLLSDADLLGMVSQAANARTPNSVTRDLVMVVVMWYSLKKRIESAPYKREGNADIGALSS
jgi:hypothetical protein